MVAIMLLIFTGFYIHAPQSFRLFGNMDGARMVHFAMAYVLCFGVVLRVYYAIAAKDAKNIVFNPKTDIPNLPSMMKYYLFMSNSHPDYGKYNPGQKAMYTGWLVMALIQIITGFILYKPQVAFLGESWGLPGGRHCHSPGSFNCNLAICTDCFSPCVPGCIRRCTGAKIDVYRQNTARFSWRTRHGRKCLIPRGVLIETDYGNRNWQLIDER